MNSEYERALTEAARGRVGGGSEKICWEYDRAETAGFARSGERQEEKGEIQYKPTLPFPYFRLQAIRSCSFLDVDEQNR
jgi:hypothetical protein